MAASAETMELYFDNPKNGGGDIEKICVDDDRVTYITFKDARGRLLYLTCFYL